MSEDNFEDAASNSDPAEVAREKLAQVEKQVRGTLSTATDYIRDNPWVAVAGAAVIGGIVAVALRQSKPEPRKLEVVRDWLEDAYAKLPSKKQMRSAAEASGIPCFLDSLRKALHIH
jgi:hypothetical protein